MAVHILKRTTSKGEARWVVRCRVGGRYAPLLHLGSFRTKREAEACRQWAALELARGRVPDRRARLQEQTGQLSPLREQALIWVVGRHDLAASTRASYLQTIQTAMGAALPLWQIPPERITLQDLERFVAALVEQGASGQTIRRDLNVVKQVLDHLRVTPNHARDTRLRLPPRRRSIPDPPTAREVALIIEHTTKRYRLVVALLEATGLRVSELLALTWGDVDVSAGRVRVASGKTTRARRFVPVPPQLVEILCARVPLEDRLADRRLFPGLIREQVTHAMRRACQYAGIPLYSPHDLRHRYISRRILLGENVLEVQRDAGHSKASITTDTYGHVNTDTGEGWVLAHDALNV